MTEPAVKLTTYFGERERLGDRFLADVLFDLYERHRVRTSVLLRGVEGFARGHELHTDRLLTLSESLPAVSVAVDVPARVERLAADVLEVAGHGLATLERARLVDPGHPAPSAPADQAVKLTLYGGRSVRADGQAGYVAAIELLRRVGAAGASALLAVDGTIHGERRRARFFSRNAGVPLLLLAIGERGVLLAALPDLVTLLDDPIVTEERIQVCKSAGELIAEPSAVAERDPTGLPVWQKLTVHVEEQAKLDGHTLYVELVRRLREAGAAGTTVLRGVRGFYAEHEPFADRILSLRRNVPIHTILVDAPGSVRRLWPIVDEATRAHGLVTSELVPASHGLAGTGQALRLATTPTAGW